MPELPFRVLHTLNNRGAEFQARLQRFPVGTVRRVSSSRRCPACPAAPFCEMRLIALAPGLLVDTKGGLVRTAEHFLQPIKPG